ncbi:MAG TPA: hypothetical protein VN325_09720 [Steroidobacteraceae bacterium]|nr:hypothetical protein [Steroidobacteraceae bacterium]
MRNRSRDKRESEILGVLGLWQHVPPTANADELSFAHEAAYLLWMYAQSYKISRLQDSLRARRCSNLSET